MAQICCQIFENAGPGAFQYSISMLRFGLIRLLESWFEERGQRIPVTERWERQTRVAVPNGRSYSPLSCRDGGSHSGRGRSPHGAHKWFGSSSSLRVRLPAPVRRFVYAPFPVFLAARVRALVTRRLNPLWAAHYRCVACSVGQFRSGCSLLPASPGMLPVICVALTWVARIG